MGQDGQAENPPAEIPEDPDPVGSLLRRHGIENWDWLLVGDGSGSRRGYAIGWACAMIPRVGPPLPLRWGGMSDGTVNMAEPLAYLGPLLEIAANLPPDVFVRVHVVTDSEYVRGRAENRGAPDSKNWALWNVLFDSLPPQLVVKFHWEERGHCLNAIVDEFSREARRSIHPGPLEKVRSPTVETASRLGLLKHAGHS